MSTYTNLLFHIDYSTKYRRRLIADAWQDELYAYMGGVIREQKGILLKVGGMPDHVHLLGKLSPSIAISDVLRDIKAHSSKWINLRGDVNGRFEWQTGYGAFSVSESQGNRVREYIADQRDHHEQRSFEDEFLDMLNRHNISFDLKYVFEQDIVS